MGKRAEREGKIESGWSVGGEVVVVVGVDQWWRGATRGGTGGHWDG